MGQDKLGAVLLGRSACRGIIGRFCSHIYDLFFQDAHMKRTTVLILAVSGAFLLGGCVPVWDVGGRHGHDRGYDSGRGYDRGHDDRGYDRGYDRRDNDHRYDRNRDRDDRDD